MNGKKLINIDLNVPVKFLITAKFARLHAKFLKISEKSQFFNLPVLP